MQNEYLTDGSVVQGDPRTVKSAPAEPADVIDVPDIQKTTLKQHLKPTRRDFHVAAVTVPVGIALGFLLKGGCDAHAVRQAAAQQRREDQLRRFQDADIQLFLLRNEVQDTINNLHGRNPAQRLERLQQLRQNAGNQEQNIRGIEGNGRLLERINAILFDLDGAIHAAQQNNRR